MKIAMTGSQWAQRINMYGCQHQTLDGKCKYDNLSCPHLHDGEECSGYCSLTGTVDINSLDSNLRTLIKEANGSMLFIENGDTRFSKEELSCMMDCIAIKYPFLCKYVEIDISGKSDAMITIYEGIGRVVFSRSYKQ